MKELFIKEAEIAGFDVAQEQSEFIYAETQLAEKLWTTKMQQISELQMSLRVKDHPLLTLINVWNAQINDHDGAAAQVLKKCTEQLEYALKNTFVKHEVVVISPYAPSPINQDISLFNIIEVKEDISHVVMLDPNGTRWESHVRHLKKATQADLEAGYRN